MLGMAKALNNNGWDAVALNFRGCSGCNRKLRFYHSGETGDLHTVISHIVARDNYAELVLIGFSLGGNVVLKYLGEQGAKVHRLILGAVAFSVPCDLKSSAIRIAEFGNRIYLIRFLRMLRQKIRTKMQIMPESINDHGYERIKTFKDFDDHYTARIYGFENAEDYWKKASSKPFLPKISVPTLLINAADDPFLADPCYPLDEAANNANLSLEIPKSGGHVGFVTFNQHGVYWSESRALAFINSSEKTQSL
jgi:predicted alpha/beta-fold hydrolase